ncbi:RES family NAD+ phosphorylase [Solitalea lacus]|uniref:RES family NAD+ phosphorylase n=1 Tax=Solitalea lacus TaxID=2911172 RepID=UPI001EDA614F|nr:RES family NAD+ phosphorylase [Solitalea lacus]UKJ06985.1 RES family NAD+ phosphorylase [Solitalea lacus]
MLVYRISLTKYANVLAVSGRAARWNSNGVFMIYSAASVALACLENVVHRNGVDLSAGDFSLVSIEVPETEVAEVALAELENLHTEWYKVDNNAYLQTQQMGDKWTEKKETLLMKVPSSISPYEYNYLINPHHSDFSKVRIVSQQKFVFDSRIKGL